MRGASAVSTLSGPARAGGLRHRVLAARGSQAPAHAEAEEPRRPDRVRHRRRRRHRPRDRRAAAGRGRLRRAGRHRRGGPGRRPSTSFAKRFGEDAVRGVALDVTDEAAGAASRSSRPALAFGGLDILVSNAGIASSAPIEDTDARDVEPQHRHPGDRLFPRLAGGLPAVPAPEARRQRRLRLVEERSRRPRPTPRPIAPPRRRRSTSRAASRSRARRRHPRQHRQSGRGAARLEDLDRRVARAAGGLLEARRSTSSRSITASARS